jgi:hypothetical protein
MSCDRAGTPVISERAGHPQHRKPLEVSMSQSESFTFYTYASVDKRRDDRWEFIGIYSIFFDDEDSARAALRELREDVESEPENSWSPMQLERIETVPISKQSLLALLNDGVGSIVKSYEIIDIID